MSHGETARRGEEEGEEEEEVQGGCHCRGVRWRAMIPKTAPILSCNCSRCDMLGYLHLIVDKDKFSLEATTPVVEYRFNTGVAVHKFCGMCGVQSFYHPRSHPDGISLNARCVDGGLPVQRQIKPFDGKNWEKNIDSIR